MKKYVVHFFVVLAIMLSVSVQATILWDFDSTGTTPTSFTGYQHFLTGSGYITVGKGVGGSKALRIYCPSFSRANGGTIALSSGTTNLSFGNTTMYFSVIATNTCSFGVAFQIQDTSCPNGYYQFIAPGVSYAGSTCQPAIGGISTTAFNQVFWNVSAFDAYHYSGGSHITATHHPDLTHLTNFEFIFQQPHGVTQGPLSFYLDNIGAFGSTGGAPPPELTNTNYLWTWNTNSISNNLGSAQSQFFSFCTSPWSNASIANYCIYYDADPDAFGANSTNVRSFLTTAHGYGFKVLFLDGEPTWVTSSANMAQAKANLSSILKFNLGGNTTQRFDGVQYDIEPYTLSGWASNESSYWSNFTTLLTVCQATINQYNISNTPHMYFEETIPIWYDTKSNGITGNRQIQSIIDSVAIMDYSNTSASIISGATTILSIATSLNKKVIVGLETGDFVPSSITFYGKSVKTMQSIVTTCQSIFSRYSSFNGWAIDDYDSYTTMYYSNATSSKYYNGIIWDFDSTVTSPTAVTNFGYFYVYGNSTNNTKGIGGSHALQIAVPFESNRGNGGGFYAFNNVNNINLVNGSSTSKTVYWSIMANETCNMGVAFGAFDTSGSLFVPGGAIYITDSVQLVSSISTTSFQQLTWDISKFHVYKAGHSTGRSPDLKNLTQFEWFFPTTKNHGSGSGNKTTGLKFYLDNVGATSGTPAPRELMNYELFVSNK